MPSAKDGHRRNLVKEQEEFLRSGEVRRRLRAFWGKLTSCKAVWCTNTRNYRERNLKDVVADSEDDEEEGSGEGEEGDDAMGDDKEDDEDDNMGDDGDDDMVDAIDDEDEEEEE